MNKHNLHQQDTEAVMTCPEEEDEEAYEAYMEKYDHTEQKIMDSQSAMLMDAEEIIYDAEYEEEYEILRALEHEDWMQRKADIVCIRTQCSMNGTEIRELQNDGYVSCSPYYDSDGYLYFQKRIVIQY